MRRVQKDELIILSNSRLVHIDLISTVQQTFKTCTMHINLFILEKIKLIFIFNYSCINSVVLSTKKIELDANNCHGLVYSFIVKLFYTQSSSLCLSFGTLQFIRKKTNLHKLMKWTFAEIYLVIGLPLPFNSKYIKKISTLILFSKKKN